MVPPTAVAEGSAAVAVKEPGEGHDPDAPLLHH